MKTFIIIIFYLMVVDGRLLPSNKTKALEGAQTDHPNPAIRQTRDVTQDRLTGISSDREISADFIRSYNTRKTRFLKTSQGDTKPGPVERVARDSSEKKLERSAPNSLAEPKPDSIKKPGVKMNEVQYEDEFQSRLSRSHASVMDSGDHEDEDFSLDDYDFDLNHDEFAGRGKPLEPRLDKSPHSEAKSSTRTPDREREPTTAKPSKVTTRPQSKKHSRSAAPADSAKIIDYYDDFVKVGKTNETSVNSEESAEEFKKSQRVIRSWDWQHLRPMAASLKKKAEGAVPKILGLGPIFPQNQLEDNLSLEQYRNQFF